MSDYSSDGSVASNESVATHATEASAALEAALARERLERRLDTILYYDDGSLKFPFDHIRNPETVILRARRGRARAADVERRLNFKELRAWQAMWRDGEGKFPCRFDAGALDALVEVGFRAGNDDFRVMCNVVCKLLDARYV